MSRATKARAQQIVLMSYNGKLPPDDWDLFDLALYHAMRLLYAEYGLMLVNKADATKLRTQLIEKWREAKTEGDAT